MIKIRARTSDDKEYRKSIILDTARHLFLSNSQSLPSVSEIVKECKLSKGSIYNYFNTKEEIFLEILIEEYRKWFYELSEVPISRLNYKDDLFKGVLQNQLLLELSCISQTIIEKNIKKEKLIDFKNFLGSHLEILSQKLSFILPYRDKEICEKLVLSFSILTGLYQSAQISNQIHYLKDDVKYSFLFPAFEETVEEVLKTIWI